MNSPVAWVLVLHIIGFVFWMGGLLVATQVLAAHTRQSSAEVRQAMEGLERKLLTGVAHPGAAITVLAGVAVILLQPDYLHRGWLHAKLFLVAILIGLDVAAYLRAKALQSGRVEVQRREFKILHGAISLIFLGIVILVMIKPF
jgi:putative membrane protein